MTDLALTINSLCLPKDLGRLIYSYTGLTLEHEELCQHIESRLPRFSSDFHETVFKGRFSEREIRCYDWLFWHEIDDSFLHEELGNDVKCIICRTIDRGVHDFCHFFRLINSEYSNVEIISWSQNYSYFEPDDGEQNFIDGFIDLWIDAPKCKCIVIRDTQSHLYFLKCRELGMKDGFDKWKQILWLFDEIIIIIIEADSVSELDTLTVIKKNFFGATVKMYNRETKEDRDNPEAKLVTAIHFDDTDP